MNPGELREKISILKLNQNDNSYTWEQSSTLWTKVERLNSNNLFSRVGIGAKSIKFIIRRKSDLSLHDAFKWNGKHCFLTDIVDINPMYYEVTVALIEPRLCAVKRTGKPVLNELNRPVYSDDVTLTFPACLTEKYIGFTQGEPMGVKETRYVMVTPKSIKLQVGELVTIDETDYTVIIPHVLDEFKNEYEIIVKEDA